MSEQAQARRVERVRWEFLLEARTPIAHHQENIGNEAIFMRKKVRRRGGFEYVPYITGGAMRNRLRAAWMDALLEAAGLTSGVFSEDEARMLYNGGSLTGSDGAFRLDLYRELCELVPPMALLGGCAGNQINPSRVVTEDATLICREYEPFAERWIIDEAGERHGALETASGFIESTQRVRSDVTSDPAKQFLLTDAAKIERNRRLLARAQASDDDDAVEKEKEKGGMMPRTMELLCQGSLFAWAVEGYLATDLERDAFAVGVLAFLANARVGGKVKSEGMGWLRVVAANQVKFGDALREIEKMNTAALAPSVGALFRAHVAERRDRIVDFVARAAKPPKKGKGAEAAA